MSDAAVMWALVLLAVVAFAAGYLVRAGLGRSSQRPVDRDYGGVPDEVIAVIAAAVAEVIDGPHRIVRVRGLTPDDLGWMLEGRMQHHASHKPHH